jgi:HSP20 family molecular chaperone IbpA
MKKILSSLAVATLLTLPLSANDPFTSTQYDQEFAKMQEYFNSLMQSSFANAKIANLTYPRVDIKNSPKAYIIEFDLAGVDKKDIKLSIDENNLLTLSGKKEQKVEDKSQGYLKQEIFYGSFQRVIKLPDDIDQSKLTTEFKDGILTLTLPKKEVKKPKAKIIPIQ